MHLLSITFDVAKGKREAKDNGGSKEDAFEGQPAKKEEEKRQGAITSSFPL